MRRTLMLLALLPAGIGGATTAEPTATAAGVHGIAAIEGPGPAAFVRSAGGVPVAWQECSGPGPRPLSRRTDLLRPAYRLPETLPARSAACHAQAALHRTYAAPFALARAGLPAFHTTAPPPFRFV